MLAKYRFSITSLFSLSFCLLLMACTTQVSEEAFIESAENLVSEGSFNQLEIVSKNYLADNKEARIARAYLSRAYIGKGEYQSAVEQWNRINDKNTLDLSMLSDSIVEAYYFLGEYEEAQSVLAASYLNVNSPRAELLSVLIKLKLSPEDMLSQNVALNFNDQQDAYAVFGIALLDSVQANNQEPIKAFFSDDILSSDPLILSLAAEYFFQQSEYAKAEDYFEQYLSQRPEHHTAYLSFVKVLLAQDKVEKASIEIDELLADFPNQPLANQQKAKIALMQDDLALAKVHIERAINAGFTTKNNFLVAGLINIKLNNYEQAINNLEKALTGVSQESDYVQLLQYAKARVGTNSQAVIASSERAITSIEDLNNIAALLDGYRETGNTTEASAVLNSLVLQTSNTSAKFRLALQRASLAPLKGDELFSLAQDILSEGNTAKGVEYNQAKILTLSKLAAEGNFTQSIDMASQWAKESNYSLVDTLMLTDILLADKRYEEATKTLDAALAVREFPIYFSRKANIEFAKKNYQAAFDLSKEALSRNPLSLTFLTQYASLHQIVADTDDQFAQNLYSAYEENGLQLVYLAEYYRLIDKNQDAIKLLTAHQDKFDEMSFYTHLLLAENFIAVKDTQQLNQTIQSLGDETLPRVELFARYEAVLNALDNSELRIETLNKTVADYPNFAPARLSLATALINDGENTLALDELRKVPMNFSPDVRNQMGRAHKNTGNFNEAIAIWRKNYEAFKDGYSAILLSELYYQMNEAQSASNLLKQHIANDPSDMASRFFLAQNLPDEERGAVYEDILAMDPDNVAALTNLAWTLNTLDASNEESKQLIEKALTLAPQNPQVKETYDLIMN